MKTMTRAFLASLLALGAVGCGDDDGDDTTDVDMGPADEDMGGMDEDMGGMDEDMGGMDEDMGRDGGPPDEAVFVRVAHLIPDAPNVRLCIGPPGFPTTAPPLPEVGEVPDGIPFRAVGDYITLPIGGVTAYEARVFPADLFGVDDDCSLTDEPLLSIEVDTTVLTVDGHYTVAAMGLVTPEAVDCDVLMPGDQPCGAEQAPRLVVFEDAEIDPANAQIRVLHAIPNAPPVDVCYDPDTSAGPEPPMEIIENVAFSTASGYYMIGDDLTHDAAAPGSFRVYAHLGPAMDCVDLAALGELTIPTPAEIVAGFSELPVVTDTYAVGSVYTIFAEGIAGIDPPDDGFAAFVPLTDLP